MIKDIINSKTYKRLNIYQKEKTLLSYFHFTKFYQIPNNERIILLQEFERVESLKQKRETFDVIMKDPKEDLFDAGMIYNKKKIYFNKYYLQDGLKEIYDKTNKIITWRTNPCLNLDLLDSILHEQFHIITYKNYDRRLIHEYREIREWLIYLSIHFENVINNQNNLKNNYYHYRMEPSEFYAYKYAEENVISIFKTLEYKYGRDENLEFYIDFINKSHDEVVKSYYDETNIIIDYNELFNHIINETILSYCQNNNLSSTDLKNEINKLKCLTKEYRIG